MATRRFRVNLTDKEAQPFEALAEAYHLDLAAVVNACAQGGARDWLAREARGIGASPKRFVEDWIYIRDARMADATTGVVGKRAENGRSLEEKAQFGEQTSKASAD